MEFLEFDLHVAVADGGAYRVYVGESPVGTASGQLRMPFSDVELARRLQALEIAILKSPSARRALGQATDGHDVVSDFGTQLFGALFDTPVQLAYRRSQDAARQARKGLRVRLRVDAPELACLPWEFLYDPAAGDYLCLSTETPLVRYIEAERPLDALTVAPPIHVLALVSSPSNLPALDVAQERARVEEATRLLQKRGHLKITWMEGSTWRDLQRALRHHDVHVFHFVGHGGFDATGANGGEGVLVLTDDHGQANLLSATQVGRLLADTPSLRLAVLNSCLGAKGDASSIFSSTSATLVRRGVPAVVAMQYEISDVAAIEFSRALYEAIASGLPIDAAVGDARKAVSMQGRNTVEWATPVLHMRASNGVLFDLDRAAFRASAMQMEAISEQDVPSPASPTPTPARSRTPAAPVPAASGAKPWWKQTWALVVGVMLATVLGLGIIGMFMDDAPAPSPVAAAPATQAGGSDATPGSQQAVNAAGAQEIALDALSVTGAVVLPCDRIDQVTISSDQQPATLSVVNGSPQLIKVFWVSQPGQRTLYANLESRQRYDQPTYRGHLWILTDASGGCRTAFYATAEHANVTVNDLDRMPH